MTTAEPLVYTMAEAAQALRVTRQTIANWANRGAIPVVRIGGRRLIPRDALRARLEELQAGGTQGRG